MHICTCGRVSVLNNFQVDGSRLFCIKLEKLRCNVYKWEVWDLILTKYLLKIGKG